MGTATIHRALPCPHPDCAAWAVVSTSREILDGPGYLWTCDTGHHGPMLIGAMTVTPVADPVLLAPRAGAVGGLEHTAPSGVPVAARGADGPMPRIVLLVVGLVTAVVGGVWSSRERYGASGRALTDGRSGFGSGLLVGVMGMALMLLDSRRPGRRPS